jgi:hypothetical protein
MPKKVDAKSAFNKTFIIPQVFIEGEKRYLVLSGELFTRAEAYRRFKKIVDMDYEIEDVLRNRTRFCIMGNVKVQKYQRFPTWYINQYGRCSKPVWIINYTEIEARHRSKSILHRWFGL